jgi:peptide/nickel transport system ATP-binding protein
MYAGRVVELATADDVFGAALHPYSQALSGAFPRIGDPAARYAPSGLPGDPPDLRDLPSGCSFAPRCPRAVDACRTAEPPLVTPAGAAPDRLVACIRAGEPA